MSQLSGTVYIVDDEVSIRRSLELMLGQHGLQVVSYPSGQQFLRDAVFDGSASCVVLDLNLPDLDGLEVQKALAERGECLPVVFLSGFGTVDTAVSAMRTGATTFLRKPVDPDELLKAVQEALAASRQKKAQSVERAEVEKRLAKLTPRETQVVDMIVQGKRTKQIATELFISVKTVETHRDNIMRKLGAGNVAEVVRIVTTRNMYAKQDA